MVSTAHSPGFQYDHNDELRTERRDNLVRELHYVLVAGANFLLGILRPNANGANTTGCFIYMRRAEELREEIEALDNGAPL
jgi:hypothetical protein